MTGSAEQDQHASWVALGIRTDIPHPARVYDYVLGGKDNFAADRELAEISMKFMPEIRDSSRANRDFLARAVRFLAEAGVRQFLDIGSGLPTAPNPHDVARAVNPAARVVYVDNDPVVFLRAEALLDGRDNVKVVRGDLVDVDHVLAEAREHLDFTQPVALLFLGVLHAVTDEDDPAGLAARYAAELAPGSYLAISHSTDDFAPERTHRASDEARARGALWIPRGRDAIAAMFGGRELVAPGLVLVSRWRPDRDPGLNADRAWAYGGIAKA